jgi:hypothetical protein
MTQGGMRWDGMWWGLARNIGELGVWVITRRKPRGRGSLAALPQPVPDGSQAMRSMVASFVAMCSRAISAS